MACGHPAEGCDPSALSKHSKGLVELRALNPINAATDADGAYARGDARLIGVYGIAMFPATTVIPTGIRPTLGC